MRKKNASKLYYPFEYFFLISKFLYNKILHNDLHKLLSVKGLGLGAGLELSKNEGKVGVRVDVSVKVNINLA